MLGQLEIASVAAIVLLTMSLILLLPTNRFVRTLNWLLQVFLLICLATCLICTALVIYLTGEWLGLIQEVCEQEALVESADSTFEDTKTCVE
mmetsp:Transcript_7085/g.8187  ORF Transcript_7085/g.8187 Transcript_7085/m.8187 type:complete len:92 (-) Transcript_7085:320-595(-)